MMHRPEKTLQVKNETLAKYLHLQPNDLNTISIRRFQNFWKTICGTRLMQWLSYDLTYLRKLKTDSTRKSTIPRSRGVIGFNKAIDGPSSV